MKTLLESVKRKIRMMISRAVVMGINDAGPLQKLQIVDFAPLDAVERVGQFGFAGAPPDGSVAVLLSPGGDRLGYIVAVEHAGLRPKNLVQGESMHYSKWGDHLHLTEARQMLGRAEKWRFESDNDELMQVLIDLTEQLGEVCGKLETTTTNTIFGPMKLNDFAFFGDRESDVADIEERLIALQA